MTVYMTVIENEEKKNIHLRINFFFHLKKAWGEIWPKRSERRNDTKKYQDEDKKSTINKKLIRRLRSLIPKWSN